MIPDLFPRAVMLMLPYTGDYIMTEVMGDETVSDLLLSAEEYFRLYPGSASLAVGRHRLRNDWTMDDLRVPHQGARFEVVPDFGYDGEMFFNREYADRRNADLRKRMTETARRNKWRFKGQPISYNAKKEDSLFALAERITAYMEEYDPYGFMDSMETGESMDDARERCTLVVYHELLGGNFSEVRGWVYDPGNSYPELRKEMKLILKQLKREERRNR